MKLKSSGVNKAHSVVCINSPNKPCPDIEFEGGIRRGVAERPLFLIFQ